VLSVPYIGHSVLSSDLSGCAKAALAAFFAGQPIAACANAKPIVAPTKIAPTRLSRVPGRTQALKTVAAVSATVRDVRLQFLGDELAAGEATPAGAKVGGLRSGHATATAKGFDLRRVEFVPGVVVDGHVPDSGSARLTVTGASAAHGRLTFRADGTVTGTLNGHHVDAHAARAARAVTHALGVKVPSYQRRLQLG
jgi:hypothetical protein